MTEQVGKITLDYTYYPGEDFYCDGVVEQEILEIAKKYSPLEFPKIIEERKSWPILYHLSELRENIVDWLPMDKSMKVLEVGSGCGAITGALSRKAGEVTSIDLSKQRSLINAYRHADCDNVTIHVGNFQDIEPHLPCDYDYVCLIGVFEYGQSYIGGETPFEDFYKIIKKHVKQGGKLVIAIENKFGLKYWAGCREDHLGTFFSGIEDYPEGGGVRTFSRKGLEDIFKKCGETDYSFYYPYPDYKFMTTLFSDKRLPMVGELSDNMRNFDRDRMVLFDEKNAFDSLIKEEMFPFYSNSYMVVIGDEPELTYCRYSNDRNWETCIKTEIVDVNGVKKVRKHACNEFSADHIRHIYKSYQNLKERYKGSKLSINKCKLFDQALPYVELEYVEGITLAEMFDEFLKKDDLDGFHALFEEYVKKISYGEEARVTDYDMIFANILVNDKKWTVIDYEWTVDSRVDTKEIAFRSLYCYLLENEWRNKCDVGRALDFLGIKPEDMPDYQEKEINFQKQVMGKRMSMSQIRELLNQGTFAPVKWMGKIEESAGKDRVQVYEDKGNGYSEETSYFVEDAYVSEHELEVTLKVAGDVKHLRIDPSMDSCVCRIKELTLNGEEIPFSNRKAMTINGRVAGNSMVFSTTDPNINLHLENMNMKAENEVYLSLEVNRMAASICKDLENELKKKIRF